MCSCVRARASVHMSPYCSAHDEWLIMKLCMYVGYHDANNVSNFGGDPVTQLNFKTFYIIIYAVLRTWRSIAVTRSQFLRRLRRLQQYGGPYQPKHSRSISFDQCALP